MDIPTHATPAIAMPAADLARAWSRGEGSGMAIWRSAQAGETVAGGGQPRILDRACGVSEQAPIIIQKCLGTTAAAPTRC